MLVLQRLMIPGLTSVGEVTRGLALLSQNNAWAELTKKRMLLATIPSPTTVQEWLAVLRREVRAGLLSGFAGNVPVNFFPFILPFV
jgi:hypothetical protein